MSKTNDDNESIETELKILQNKLNGIHDTLKISMAIIIILLILVVLTLWYSSSF